MKKKYFKTFFYAVCFLCKFSMQFDFFEKVFSRMFQQICCNFYHFKDTRDQRGLRPKLCFFLNFESDIPKIFPSDIPVVEIKWTNIQTWFSNVYVWDLLILVTVRVLYMQCLKFVTLFMSHSWQIWPDFWRITL